VVRTLANLVTSLGWHAGRPLVLGTVTRRYSCGVNPMSPRRDAWPRRSDTAASALLASTASRMIRASRRCRCFSYQTTG
jgi:hypothetical protein